jgi:hypothetical protein
MMRFTSCWRESPVYRLSAKTIERLAGAVFGGYSVREIAAHAGVSKETARLYRGYVINELPKQCACGQTLKHQGDCEVRRERRKKLFGYT